QRGADDARMRRQHHRDALGPGVLVAFVVDRDAHRDPGIVDDDVEPAELRRDLVDHALDLARFGDVELPRPGPAAPASDLLCDGLCAICIVIGDGDIGAFGGEHARGCASHAAGRTGDENGQSAYGPAELLEGRHAVSSRLLLLVVRWTTLTSISACV